MWRLEAVCHCEARKEKNMVAEKTVLKRNADWYYANLDSLLPKYNGKYIAIADGRVLGDYDDFNRGVDATLSAGHPLGSFIVHLCVPREQETPWICLSGRADFSRSMS
jgi:hypothetical protein